MPERLIWNKIYEMRKNIKIDRIRLGEMVIIGQDECTPKASYKIYSKNLKKR